MLNAEQRAQALSWYAQGTANLQTIAQHFGLTTDQLAREIRTK
jgi:transposase-like protein